MTNNKLDAAKRRITALLDRADHPNTEEHEATACREKAETLMKEYRIERAMLHLKGHDKRRFEVKEYKVSYNEATLLSNIFDHVNCHMAYSNGAYTAVGYPEDIFYGETLFRRAKAEIDAYLYPIWKDEETFESNIYRLRRSGMQWENVWGHIPYSVREERNLLVWENKVNMRLIYFFRKEEKRRGDDSFVWRRDQYTFHKSFRDGFNRRMYDRLCDLRARAAAEPTEGEYAVALLNDDEALREEFYRLFPQYRPETEEEKNARRAQYEAERKAEAERRANLTDAQRRREDERRAREERKRQRDWQKFYENNRPDPTAWGAGTASADKVRLRLDDEIKNNERLLDT